MPIYDIWNIYNVLRRFVEVRQMTPIKAYMSQADFTKNMRDNGLVLIECVKVDKSPVLIVLTDIDSEIPGKKQAFLKMITFIKKYITHDIILISHKIITTSISEYVKSVGYNISSLSFERFIIDMTRAPLVPKHRLMSEDEITILLNQLFIEKRSLPSISINDTQAIWIGAKLGDVVEITRYTESTGYSLFYRHCIP